MRALVRTAGGGTQPASHARIQARMCSPLLTPGGCCPLLATTRSRPARPSLDRGGHAPRTRRLKVGARESGGRAVPSCARRGGGMQPASHARMQARMCSPLLTPAGRCPLLATTRSRPARPSAAPVKGDKGGHAPRTRRLKVGARESGGRAVPLCARRGGGMQPASQPHMQARMCSPLTPAGRCPLPPHAAAPHGRAPPLSRATRAGMHHARGA